MALTKEEQLELDQLNLEAEEAKGTYLGERPGIDNPLLRKIASGATTVAQIAAPIATGIMATPAAGAAISIATAGLGEFIKSKYIEGEPMEQALKEGGTGVIIDAALLGSGKVLKPILKYTGLLGATKGMSKTAKIFAKKNFSKITKPLKAELDDIAKATSKTIGDERSVLGRMIGKSKKEATESLAKIKGKPIRKSIAELLKEERIIVKNGKIARGDIKNEVLKKVQKQADLITDATDVDDMFAIIDNMDDALVDVYNKEIRGEGLNIAESAAKRVRGIVNEKTIEVLADTVGADKANYAKYVGILNKELGEIKRALKSSKGTYDLMKRSVERGRTETLKNLSDLDDLLPNDQKFFIKMINRIARDNLEGLSRIYPSIPGVIEKGLELVPRAAAAVARGMESPVLKTIGKAAEIGGLGAINN